jgi:hypothetical protein
MKLPNTIASAALVMLLLIALVVGTASRARAASDALNNVLSQIRDLGSSDLRDLVRWAKNGHPMPDDPVFSPEKTEADIDRLHADEQSAVLSWLQGDGRSDLHSVGASDSDIGPRRDGLDQAAPTPTPTPNPWRNVPLATASLNGAAQGPIQVLGGFAAVKRDGTSAIACLSFKNTDPRVAKHVVVDFPLLGDGGQVLGTLELDRPGEFSSNVGIYTFDSMGAWQSGGGPVKSFAQNCIQRDLPTAALPFLQLRAVGYAVVHVDFADGTSWVLPGR